MRAVTTIVLIAVGVVAGSADAGPRPAPAANPAPAAAAAQVTARADAAEPARADTPSVTVPTVEVTALRGADRVADIPAATFVVSRRDLERSGVPRLSTLLQTLPGLFGYRQRGSGDVEVVDPRGFTASGESSYLKLLVNGQDARGLENGDVDWDSLLPDDVERVEVVQGPGAWVYGDASEGGIVNVVRPDPAARFRSDCAAHVGSFGLRTLGVGLSGSRSASLRASGRGVDGWRSRSRERVYSGGGEVRARWGGREASADVSYLDADRQDPGTLTPDQLAADREQAENPRDFRHGRRGLLGLHLQSRPGPDPVWRISPYLKAEDADELRTLLLQPLIHHTRGYTGGGDVEWRAAVAPMGRHTIVLANADAEQARLESDYSAFDPDHGGGPQVGRVRSWRTTLAASAGARIELAPSTLARLSLRGDLVRVHSKDLFSADASRARTLGALSPLVALSRSFGERGSAYVSASTAFRVPTLYQLFDRRPFVVAPDSSVSISNAELDPQRSASVEIGGRYADPSGRSGSLALYSTWVRDEIDFDLVTLRYANINKSWHRGIEAQGVWPLPGHLTARGSGAWTPTTFRGGTLDRRQINGVPVGAGYAAVGWGPLPWGSVELGARFVGRQWLDKLEESRLPGVATWELGLEAHHGRVRGALRVLNLFDRRYSDSGFIGAFREERYSPAAPRGVTASLGLE